MPDPKKPDITDPEAEDTVKPAMTEQEIRDKGLVIDIPWESGEADPKPLQYADLGPEKEYAAPEGWDARHVDEMEGQLDTVDDDTPPADSGDGTGAEKPQGTPPAAPGATAPATEPKPQKPAQ